MSGCGRGTPVALPEEPPRGERAGLCWSAPADPGRPGASGGGARASPPPQRKGKVAPLEPPPLQGMVKLEFGIEFSHLAAIEFSHLEQLYTQAMGVALLLAPKVSLPSLSHTHTRTHMQKKNTNKYSLSLSLYIYISCSLFQHTHVPDLPSGGGGDTTTRLPPLL